MCVISTEVDDSRDGGGRATHGAVAERSDTHELQTHQKVARFLRFGRNDKYN